MLFEPWHEFRHSLVRQLAFVIASPNIIQSLPPELDLPYTFELHQAQIWNKHYQAYLPRLKALDLDPTPLHQFLAPLRSTRLGLRFEYLMWFWLTEQNFHPYRLIGHSLQQISGHHTIGEIDFLLFNEESKEIEHWEVALKYYLGHPPFLMSHWIGLNDADTLARKINHFGQKQFQFENVEGYKINRKYAVIKGQLFRPFEPDITCEKINCAEHCEPFDLSSAKYSNWLEQPSWIETQREVGFWRSNLPSQNNQLSYRRLLRHEWICPDQPIEAPVIHWWTNGLYLVQEHHQQETVCMMLKLPHVPRVPYW